MIPMERTMYQTEIRELTSTLSSLTYELDGVLDDLWNAISEGEDIGMEFLGSICKCLCSMKMDVKKELAKIAVRRDIRNALAEVWEKMEEKNGTDTRTAETADDSGKVVQTPAEEVLCKQESNGSGQRPES